jgi:predicted DNA-binding transcriptional regulator AlpA
MPIELITIAEVARQRGVSVAKAWADLARDPTHPKPVRRGARWTRFVQREISVYIIKQLAERDNIPANELDGYIAGKLAQIA